MAHLIDKSAVVAEIERLYAEHSSKHYIDEAGNVLDQLEDFLDSLEVEEVDLEKDSLTWMDINLIHHLLFDIKEDYDNGKLDKEEYYKEVLKQFKEQL